MKILGIDHAQITIPLDQVDQARAFYCGLLGLSEIPKPRELIDRGGFWLQVGPTQVHIGLEDSVERFRTKAHLAYCVQDLNYWKAKLQGNGVKLDESVPIPGCNRFEFRDPFQNRVEFLERIP